jgi:hypothetical protein
MTVAALAGAGALVVWGCATSSTPPASPTADRGERPNEPTPDGGWASFRPGPSYQPEPMRAATTTPSIQPGSPVSRDLK